MTDLTNAELSAQLNDFTINGVIAYSDYGKEVLREAARRLAAPEAGVMRPLLSPESFIHLNWPSHDQIKMLLIEVVKERDAQWSAGSTAVSEATGANVNPQRSDDVADLASSEVATEKSKLRVEGSGENRNTPAAPESGDDVADPTRQMLELEQFIAAAPWGHWSARSLSKAILAAGYRKRAAQPDAAMVNESVYQSAVQGRRDFRAAYARMLKACREARRRLEKGRALWNGPCHETASVLDEALNGPQPESRSEPDAIQAFAAELVRWCENEGGKLVSYEGGDVYRRVAVHIRSMAQARHE